MVVDDVADNREMLARRLARLQYDVRAVASGAEALAQLDGVDLVLLDVNMPEMSGLDCLRTIRSFRTIDALPVIMVTARDQPEDVVECLSLGASDYVSKPIDYAVLLARIRTWLRMKQLHDTREHVIRVASHDLRNPLTLLLGSAELMYEAALPGTEVTARMHATLGTMVDAALRMRTLITDLLDIQRLEATRLDRQRTPADLGAAVAAATSRHAVPAANKRITLTSQLIPGVVVAADAHQLDQVLDNILGNAVKYSAPGTTVNVRCRIDGARALVEVEDEGPGLTPDDLKRVFQRYARLSARPTGGESSTGLGLSIAREIIEQHSGEIGVRNNPSGRGATFWFWVPLASEGSE